MNVVLSSTQSAAESGLRQGLAESARLDLDDLSLESGVRDILPFVPHPHPAIVTRADVDPQFSSSREIDISAMAAELEWLEHCVLLGQAA